jgi:hypothetical protein
MCPSVLTSRRKVQPRASAPCKLRDYVLCFNMLGFPYAEPGFASIEPAADGWVPAAAAPARRPPLQLGPPWLPTPRAAAPPCCRSPHASPGQPHVHGVVHLISQQEWLAVQRTEGVTDSQDFGCAARGAPPGAVACGRRLRARPSGGLASGCWPPRPACAACKAPLTASRARGRWR